MSIYRNLADALTVERRSLARGFVPPVTTAQMQAILRVEATPDALEELQAEERKFRQGFVDANIEWNDPHKFQGITVYVVPYPLPAPGWRVINPMTVR